MMIALGALLLIAGLAPLALMTLPNPVPVRVSDPATQVDGIYVGTASEVYHVFPYAETPADFPVDALVTQPSARLWVKYSVLSTLDSYAILAYPGGAEVPSARDTSTPRVLEVRPLAALKPGAYYAQVPRDSLLGGTDYVYFRVTDGSAIATSTP